MYISAFPHREQLFEITQRWLADDLKPTDPMEITRIITYDSFTAWETVQEFVLDLLPRLYEGEVRKRPILNKKELKDYLCYTSHPRTARIDTLVTEYLEAPEYYYTGSPIAGLIYHTDADRILSLCRFKRINRTAEKASRYAALHIHETILAAANPRLRERFPAAAFEDNGVMDELVAAELKVMRKVRKEGLRLPADIMSVKDVVGMKVIKSDFDEKTLESAILGLPGVDILEKERHEGMYNAVHYLVELPLDADRMSRRFSAVCQGMNLAARGLPAEECASDYRAFFKSGDPTIQLDMILTTFSELCESEIGRSMHERRIFNQRQQQRLYGNIPKNIEYIIEYIFAVGLSPAMYIDEIPIKLWGRYLPDTLGYRIRQLFKMPEFSLLDTES